MAAGDLGSCAVLGAGPKLGAAIGRRFGRAGHPVALVARSAGPLEELAASLREEGVDAHAFPADLSDEAAVPALMDDIRSAVGPVEVLSYNAARLGLRARASEMDLDLFYETFRLNLVSGLVATQQVVPDMRARGRGTILFTGGTYAHQPSGDYAPVGIGKAVLRNLTFCLADELGDEGIHVAMVTISGVIAPGTEWDPDALAEAFWDLHTQPPGSFETEIFR